ncbi:MAG: fibronectin type III domain-containing protein [Microbacteriaceae bacterium]|nr:fibronectin type III domain-containing protein [Microbacteriaceae bacterium]
MLRFKRQLFSALTILAIVAGGGLANQQAIASTDCITWDVDEDGEFVCTEWANTDPDPDPNLLPAPTGLNVVTRTSSSVKLAWDAYDGATGWVVEISTDNAETWKELVIQNPAANLATSLTGLKTASAMWIRVAALTPGRTAFGDSEFVTTKGAKPVRVTVVDSKGKPVKGGKITWRMVDNSAWSSRTYGLTDDGVNDFPSAPAGQVDVTLKDAITADGALVSGSWRTTLGFDKTVLELPETEPSKHTVRVVLPNGLPVIGAEVSIPEPTPIYGGNICLETKTIKVWINDSYIDDWGDYVTDGHYEDQELCQKWGKEVLGYEGGTNIESTQVVNGFTFVSNVGPYTGKTDINSGFFSEDPEATVTYDDTIITQQQIVPITSVATRVELDYIPWVGVQSSAITANPNQLVPVEININEADIGSAAFRPAAVKPRVKVTLVAPKGAPVGKCKQTLTGYTNSKGKLTLKVCATKSGIYTIKSAGAASVKTVRMQVKNSAPMPVTSVTGKSLSLGQAKLTWGVPLFDGKLPIKTYTITAKAAGKKTVTKTVKAVIRNVTLSGLANATNYTISIIATNAKGSSDPVVVKVPVA